MGEGEEMVLTLPTGTVSGLVCVHASCSEQEARKFLLDDLCKTVETRVAVLLDELEARQEASATPAEEHALSRYKADGVLEEGLRWTIPRRVLLRSRPAFCDYQLAGEYDGKATVARSKEILGLEVPLSKVDGSLELVETNSRFELSGRKAGVKKASISQQQPQQRAKNKKGSVNEWSMVQLVLLFFIVSLMLFVLKRLIL
jgi:hypothetical protein